MEIKKAIIPIAGLGTRFLPLSKALPKEFFPLADKPIIQYIIDEMRLSGITEVIFVVSPRQKTVLNYFKKSPELEKILARRKKEDILRDLREFEEVFAGISFSFAVQKKPAGDGHAILQAAKFLGDEPVASSFGDDIVYSDVPAIKQLADIFKTCSAPVVALKQFPREKVPAYGMVLAEKIAHGLYKIKKIVEKPDISQATSNLVLIGRHILTPEVFDYLKTARPSKKGEIILAEVLDRMLSDGKTVYGCEVKGEWLECGDKMKWMKTFFYLALKDPRFGKELKDYLKTLK